MLDVKSILSSRTIITNILIGTIGGLSALGALPDGCNATEVAAGLGVAVPTLVGSGIALLALVSSYFRVKATATLV